MNVNTGQRWRKFSPAACVLILAAVIFALYSQTLSGGFVYDDKIQILGNQWITSPKFLSEIFTNHSFAFLKKPKGVISYRPLVFVVYMFEYALFGLEPWGWHLINILLHILNTVTAFFILRYILTDSGGVSSVSAFRTPLAPFIGALIFAVHPVNSETVAWVGCVPELVYTLLCMSSFLLYIKSRGAEDGGGKGLLYACLAALLFFSALFAKEPAASIPIIIFAYDCLKDKGFKRRNLKRYVPFIAAVFLYMAIRISALGGIIPAENMYPFLSGFQYFLNAVVLFVKYLQELIIPLGYYPLQLLDPVFRLSEPRAFISLVFVIAIFAATALFRKRINPQYFLAFSFVIFPLLPALYIPGISRHSFNIRYLYLPSLGFSLALSLILREVLDRISLSGRASVIRPALLILLVLPAFYSYKTFVRSAAWKDEHTLWRASLDGSPENYFALLNLGIVFSDRKLYDDAITKFTEAIRIVRSSEHPDTFVLMDSRIRRANTYMLVGRLGEAVREYTGILAEDPANPYMHFKLAYAYQQQGLFDAAILHYMTALKFFRKPSDLRDAYLNLGNSYLSKRIYERALYFYNQTLKVSPGDADALNNIGVLKRIQRRGG
ncbi:MAG: tetratricopeptide repeat protein [Thermodesulfobacteriota bacterium]